MRLIGLLLFIICLCGAPLQAQTSQDLLTELPTCDSQISSHREAVSILLEFHNALNEIERLNSASGNFDPTFKILSLVLNSSFEECAESSQLSLLFIMKVVAVVNEKANIQLGIGNSDDLTPLLAKWQEWATGFVTADLKTQFWLGSFSNYQGRGLEVGCKSYLLPVDAGMARGDNTLAELSLALSALFDPERGHPDGNVETEDWIKELDLSVAGIHIDQGFAEIALGGPLRGIGTCGDAILEAQILQTVFQFSDIKRARITEGDMNLRQVVDMSDMLSTEELRAYIYDREELDWLRD